MPNVLSSVVKTQPGLVSSPFLNSGAPSTGGTTTPLVGGSTTTLKPNTNSGLASQSGGLLGSATSSLNGTLQNTPVTSKINFGGLIPTANAATPAVLDTGKNLLTGQGGVGDIITPVNDSNNPYSTANYYAAHPNANPANNGGSSPPSSQNSVAANTYNGGVNGNGNTFPGLVSVLGSMASQPSQNFTSNMNNSGQAQTGLLNLQDPNNPLNTDIGKYTTDLENIGDQYKLGTARIGDSRTNVQEAQGEQGNLNNLYSGLIGNAQQALNTAVTNRGQQITGLTNAAGAANTAAGAATSQQSAQQNGLGVAAGLSSPQQVPYNNQYINPLTGQPISGGGGTGGSAMSSLPAQAQSAIQSYAQQIQNGSMTRGDAESRLSAYGQPGLNALNEALGPGFNTNASNASAGTTAVGQQIQTAALSTNKALDTLGSAFANLNPAQTAGIPATNNIANWIASQFGDAALQQYKTNLADARSQLIGVLNSSGGTPTGNEATAQEYLPDNMTKQQFDQNVGTAQNPGIVRQLIQQKVSSFTASGQQNGTTNSNSGGSIYNF